MNTPWNNDDETTLTLPVPVEARSRRWLLAAGAVAIFACGTVVGGLVAAPSKPVPKPPANPTAKVKRPELAAQVTQLIDLKLKLTDEQEAAVAELVRAAERDLKATRRKQLDELIPRLEAFDGEVTQLLTPAQAKVWKKYAKSQLDRIKRGEPGVSQFMKAL